MTPPRSPAGHAARILARADETDVDTLSQVIAEAFFDLPPSRWLVEDPAARRAIFPAYFRLYVEHAMAVGLVHTTPDRDAVALWLPAGPAAPGPPDGYNARLAAITGPLTGRFEAFDAALEAHHPAAVAHQHLAILAVRPGRQGHGTGTTTAPETSHEPAVIPTYQRRSSPEPPDQRRRSAYSPRRGQPARIRRPGANHI